MRRLRSDVAHRFGSEFAAALERAGMPLREFARRADCADSLPSKIINGQRRPPLQRVEDWCAILGLEGDDRERFLLHALLAHAPAAVTALVDDLIEQAGRGRQPPRLLLPFPSERSRLRVAEPSVPPDPPRRT